jgi:hypothetical protein
MLWSPRVIDVPRSVLSFQLRAQILPSVAWQFTGDFSAALDWVGEVRAVSKFTTAGSLQCYSCPSPQPSTKLTAWNLSKRVEEHLLNSTIHHWFITYLVHFLAFADSAFGRCRGDGFDHFLHHCGDSVAACRFSCGSGSIWVVRYV